MSTDNPEPEAPDLDAIRADIEQTRAELADTVEQVVDKLDVKAQVGNKAESAKHAAAAKAAHAKAATPARVQSAMDTLSEKAGPPAHRATEAMAPHQGKIIAGAAVMVVVLVIARRTRRGN